MNGWDRRGRLFAGSAALLGWLGLGLQLFVIWGSRRADGLSATGGLVNFLSYFTIWSNLATSAALACIALTPGWKFALAIANPRRMTALASCIALVGLTYHLLLRGLWQPTGTQLLADNLLHSATPALFLIFWWLFVPPSRSEWTDALRWCLYPGVYLLFALLRGAADGFYAYPFINVTTLGLPRVLLNSAGVVIGFLVLAFMLLWLDKRKR